MVEITPTVTVKAEFRARGYPEEHVRELRSLLEPVGRVRTRPIHMPEAGGAAEICFVLEFIRGGAEIVGTEALSALIGAGTLRAVDLLHQGLRRFKEYRKRVSGYTPEVRTLTLSFDEFDIVVQSDVSGFLENSAERLKEIHKHLTQPPLSEAQVNYVRLPVEFDQGRWYSPPSWQPLRYSFRYWAVGTWDPAAIIMDIYDSGGQRMLNVPRESLPPA